jgi:hypothetical protein
MVLEAEVGCPQCGEPNIVWIDTSAENYNTVEDCTVCCRPMHIVATCEPGEITSLDVEAA